MAYRIDARERMTSVEELDVKQTHISSLECWAMHAVLLDSVIEIGVDQLGLRGWTNK